MTRTHLSLATRWPTRAASAGCEVGEHVFVPGLDPFPPALRDILGLLPVADINGSLLTTLAAASAAEIARETAAGLIAGIFAADPFLDLVELTARLRGAGIGRIANYPTLQHYDGATAEGFAAVGYDVQAELTVLSIMAASGFEPFVYVATLQIAETALAAGFETLVFHPGPPPIAASERTAQAKIATLVRKAGARLLLHASPSTDETGENQPISP